MSAYRFLEPYHFMKSAVEALAAFGDTFLKLLGYGNYLEELEAAGSSDFLENMRLFREKGLRYF